MRTIRLTITVDVVTTDDHTPIKELLIPTKAIVLVDDAIHNQCVSHAYMARVGIVKGELSIVNQESKQ